MNTPSIICTDISMTVVFSGESPKVINSNHPNFQKCREAIRNRDWQSLHKMINVEEAVRSYVSDSGNITVANGTIYYKGEQLHGLIVDRVFQFMRENLPFEPLINFINNMMENPSFRSRNELYGFLEHEGLPITEDGHFLAYKAVRNDYYDIYSGKIYNGIGTRVSFARRNVDDDCNRGCSHGLHAGSLDYVRGYGHSDSKFLIVKINPKDVVSVPSEDSRKLRCCEYVVLSEFKEQLNNPCYGVDGSDFSWEDDFEDEDDDCCGNDCCTSKAPKTRGDEYDYYNY
jgi:hypothetical protein